MVGLAARVWQHAGLAAATSDALRQAEGGRRRGRPRRPGPRRAAAERRGADLRRRSGRPRCDRDAGRASTTARRRSRARPPGTCEPWGVVSYRGRWYVVGLRHRPRRPSGCSGSPGSQGDGPLDGEPGSYARARGHRPARARRAARPDPAGRARRRCWSGPGRPRPAPAGHRGRRGRRGPDGEGWDRLDASPATGDLVDEEVLPTGPTSCVEAPARRSATSWSTGSPPWRVRS